jgi:hypothetical protein
LNEIQAGEMVEFASGVKGIALNLENENRSGDSQIAKELTYMYVTEMCLNNSFGISSSV